MLKGTALRLRLQTEKRRSPIYRRRAIRRAKLSPTKRIVQVRRGEEQEREERAGFGSDDKVESHSQRELQYEAFSAADGGSACQ